MYPRSALWRQSLPGGLIGPLVVGTLLLQLPVLRWLGLLLLGAFLLGMLYEVFARRWALAHGYKALFVLPSGARWVARRLQALGYEGPVSRHLWEMHVIETRRWTRPGHGNAVRLFRTAYTQDRLAWLDARPPNVGVVFTTFNRLPPKELAGLVAREAWIHAGPLHPRLPRLASSHRVLTTQRRMFGCVVSLRDRTNANEWITVYVPPRRPTG